LQNLDFPALYGKNQVQNAANALTAIDAMMKHLPVKESAIRAGLDKIKLRGRFEIIADNPKIILDVGHNPHAVTVFAKNLECLREKSGENSKVHAIFGVMADKDIHTMLSIMKNYVDYWYLVDLPVRRAAKASQLKKTLKQIDQKPGNSNHNVVVFPKVFDALLDARSHAKKNDTIIAFGSFWVIAGLTQNEAPIS
jgi:dihydrofolate synthase/folylpolyglutamate synthase